MHLLTPDVYYWISSFVSYNDKLKLRRASRMIGANIKWTLDDTRNRLEQACRRGAEPAFISTLLAAPLPMTRDHGHCYGALLGSIFYGHTKVVRTLLSQSHIDPGKTWWQNDSPKSKCWPLTTAVSRGHLDIVKLLLSDPRVDPGVGDNQAVMLAKSPELVALLIKDPRVSPLAAFEPAVSRGDVASVKLLLEHEGVDIEVQDVEMAIVIARTLGHIQVLHLLVHDERTK